MSYRSVLPEVFPFCIVTSEAKVAEKLAILIAPSAEYPNGSSFAVTTDVSPDMRCLYLSSCSAKRLGVL
jgi:hypothetical protein